jgi:hypothetical protein
MDTGLLQLGSNAPGPPIEANKARQVRALLHLGFGVQTLISTLPCVATEHHDKSRTFSRNDSGCPPHSVLGNFPQNVSTSMN